MLLIIKIKKIMIKKKCILEWISIWMMNLVGNKNKKIQDKSKKNHRLKKVIRCLLYKCNKRRREIILSDRQMKVNKVQKILYMEWRLIFKGPIARRYYFQIRWTQFKRRRKQLTANFIKILSVL